MPLLLVVLCISLFSISSSDKIIYEFPVAVEEEINALVDIGFIPKALVLSLDKELFFLDIMEEMWYQSLKKIDSKNLLGKTNRYAQIDDKLHPIIFSHDYIFPPIIETYDLKTIEKRKIILYMTEKLKIKTILIIEGHSISFDQKL